MQDTNTYPVAHVAKLLCEANTAYYRLDEEVVQAKGARERELERQFRAVTDRVYALEDAASLDRTSSAIGALLQVALANVEIERLVSLTDPDELRAAREHQRTITRLLYSVLTFLEESYGIRREEIGAHHYAGRDLDPYAAVEQALAA